MLLRFLSLTPKGVMLAIAFGGLISGACSAALIALINRTIHADASATWILAVAILLLTAAKILSGNLSKWLLVKFAQQTLLDLTIRLCRKVLSAPFRLVEQTGPHRILVALTSDVAIVGAAMLAVPTLAINAAVVAGCAAYLAWLFPLGFGVLAVVIAAGAGVYALLHRSAFQASYAARESRDELMGSFRSLTDGIKELKLHQRRRQEFLDRNLEKAAEKLKFHTLQVTRKYMQVDASSQALFYLMLVTVLVFVPRDLSNASEVLTGYIFAALYMMGPVWTIIGSIPTFLNGATSLNKLDALGLELGSSVADETEAALPPVVPADLELHDVYFHYGEGQHAFSLGPIDMTLRPGETVFIVGGNGSGKTTLLKLLAGLYTPDQGQVLLGGEPITATNIEWYRQHFAVVFFDFHLFDRLLGAAHADVDGVSNELLVQLELDHKVTVSGGQFSTTELSQGQRKRLALLTALIEERPICIFDEWAADQDPHYKQIFYDKILPMLKEHGCTTIVVTHDDRFFDRGDRVIELENGRIRSSGTPRRAAG